MNEQSKNHTISKVIAKILLRLFVIILALAFIPLLSDNKAQLQNTYLYFENKWVLIFPLLLFVIFVTLLFTMLKNKYTKTEVNWLFSLSTIMLSIYLLMLYSRIYPIFAS
ncbi:hypothetical protein [Sphingobacterium sp. SYP-B4668]|uniref:hypothetical protein n=1 Tax=Sphingobacterium sp. SYP-B4668 TaxID=2996035 RepID=UPI0022DE91A2|nr:hypothetical protein [Sphingobacterium sp. SYP-B4668]